MTNAKKEKRLRLKIGMTHYVSSCVTVSKKRSSNKQGTEDDMLAR